jgi:RNA polymerase sigma-70 factor (ECF subfamily)
MTEPELISGIARHDREAYRHLVDRFQQGVILTAYHFIGNMEDAEDMSQEIFVDVIRSIPAFRQKSSLGTWIYRITINRSLNYLKKKKRAQIMQYWTDLSPFSREKAETSGGVVLVGETGHEEETRKHLYNAMGKLPENQRIAFVLAKLDDKSYNEVAEIMHVSISAVESLLHRAKGNLKKYLEPLIQQKTH